MVDSVLLPFKAEGFEHLYLEKKNMLYSRQDCYAALKKQKSELEINMQK
jgi:hypothetical protein